MKKVAILQSNYIPWKGYFDLIAAVDEFILYDDMQFTRRDWRNRNQIKTPNGPQWLTVPVKSKGKYHQAIRETEVDGTDWAGLHWSSLTLNYRRCPHFDEITELIAPLYRHPNENLSALNRAFTDAICGYLQIDTKISNCWDYHLLQGKTERLVDLCSQAGASVYISGPAAKNYIVEDVFREAGIGLEWFDYAAYPEYPQLWGAFVHGVTILDLLFNCGKDTPHYMRYVV
jgi:hypothetical protein